LDKKYLQDLFDLTGKVAIVSGGTGSIGFSSAQTLAAAGAQVMLNARSVEALKDRVEKITADGGQAAYVAGDPAVHADVTRVVEETVKKWGGVDILVAAHGVSIPGAITEQTDEVWQQVVDANFTGTYYFCKDVVKQMVEQGRGGKIILIGSVRGELGHPKYSAYCPSKGAVHLLAKTLAWELGAQQINVNVIAPAFTRSPLTQWVFDEPGRVAYKAGVARIPLGRPGEPEDFEGATLFLASKASDWVTGHILCVDGGYTAG
jgi:NAD(P)-dependent dehydrogenase (short-subunit alcohol dehydrogenase family)